MTWCCVVAMMEDVGGTDCGQAVWPIAGDSSL